MPRRLGAVEVKIAVSSKQLSTNPQQEEARMANLGTFGGVFRPDPGHTLEERRQGLIDALDAAREFVREGQADRYLVVPGPEYGLENGEIGPLA